MNISTRKLWYLHTAILAAALSPFIVSTVYAEIGPSSAHERANDAYQLRKDRAKANHDKVLPAHPDNGDEALYGNRLIVIQRACLTTHLESLMPRDTTH